MKLSLCIAFTCMYFTITCMSIHVTAEAAWFIQEPKTDKDCYLKGENASLTASYQLGGTTPLDSYKVVLTTNKPDEIGDFVEYNGSVPLFDDAIARDLKRFQVTTTNVSRTVEFRMDVYSLEYLDEYFPFYAFIFESYSGKVLNVSSVGATFLVSKTCSQRPQPTTCTSSVTTVTTTQSNNVTSTGNIPAKPIPRFGWGLIAITVIIVFGFILVICFCIRRHLQMGKRNQSNGTTDPNNETTVYDRVFQPEC